MIKSEPITVFQHGRPTVFDQPDVELDAPFNYSCQGCHSCCRSYTIPAGPYEILRLARHLGISTTEFIECYTADGLQLAQHADGRCIFLDESGCSVHSDRPAACRAYPLGVMLRMDGEYRVLHKQLRPGSKGEYGESGTVRDFLTQQGIWPYLQALERYLELLDELEFAVGKHTGSWDVMAEGLLDPDKMISRYFPESLEPGPMEAGPAADLHIAAVKAWLAIQLKDTAS